MTVDADAPTEDAAGARASDVATTEDADAAGDSLIRAVIGMGRRPAPPALVPGQVIDDSFRIERVLGAGGMGVVYLARDLRLGREVAIKLHATDATALGSERLAREAAAIAQLSHANVVTVHRIATHDGHPFVAMEYVDGGTARSWLATRPRSPREIVALYLAAGRGLAAAHRAGLVHRDFKPDNVLVGTDDRVRVADFGLVQGTLPSSTDGDDGPTADTAAASTLTRSGAVMGTPAYMAPEQHRAGKVGPAADQFAFCVALWEALHGARPFAGADAAQIDAAIEAGRIVEPPADRRVPRHVRRALERGLAADPAARFPTMDALLHELARDPATRRRRVIAGTVIAMLLGAGGITAWTMVRGADPAASCGESGERLAGIWDAARRREVETAFLATGKPHAGETFTRTSAHLDRYAMDWVSARIDACRATHVRGEQSAPLLDLRYHCLDRRRAGLGALVELFAAGPDPLVLDQAINASRGLDPITDCADTPTLSGTPPRPSAPAARAEIERLDAKVAEARALHASGKFSDGVAVAAPLIAPARATGYSPLIGGALRVLAQLQSDAGDHVTAKATGRESVKAAAAAHDDRAAAEVWIFLLQVVTTRTRELEEAEALIPVIDAAIARAGAPPILQLRFDSTLAVLRQEQGRYGEARALLERALASAERTFAPDDPAIASTLNRLANVLTKQGALADARGYLERAIAVQERTLGAEHPHLAMSLHNLGSVLYRAGTIDTARATFARALAMKEKLLGPAHRDLASTLSHLGIALRSLGQFREARPHLERSLAISAASFGPEHPTVARARINLAGVLAALGSTDEAIPAFERGLAQLERDKGPTHPELADVLIELGNLRTAASDRVGARRDLERARTILEAAVGPEHAEIATVIASLADLLAAEGKPGHALREYKRALDITLAARGAAHPQIARIRAAMGMLMIETGDHPAARIHLAAALTVFEAAQGTDHPDVARCLLGQARIELVAGAIEGAFALLDRAIAIHERASGADSLDLAEPLTFLAQAHLVQGRAADAIAIATRASAIQTARGRDPRSAAQTRFVLAQARWLAGADRDAALADARASRAELATAGATRAELREIDAWLRNPRK